MRYSNYLLLIGFFLLTTQCSDDSDMYSLEEDLKMEQVDDFTKSLKTKSREKKNEKWQQDFASIKDEILSRNKNKKFLDRLVRSVGHPNWDEAFSATPTGEGFPYIVPFLKPDDTRTNAVLMVTRHKNGKNLKFNLVEREPFLNLLLNGNAKKINMNHWIYASLFRQLDWSIYKFKDEILLKWLKTNEDRFLLKTKGLKNCERIEVCYWKPCEYAIRLGEDKELKCGSWVCSVSYECNDSGVGGPISGGGYYGGTTGGGGSGSGGGTCYTCEVDANYPQDSDPSAAYANLNEGQYYKLLVEGFTLEEIDIIDKLKKAIQDKIQDLSNFLPQTSEEWNLLAEAIKIELEKIVTNPRTLAKLVLPGVADIESALKNFNSGSYLNAAFDISMALVDLMPGTKLANVSLAVASKVRRSLPVVKIFKRIKTIGNSKVVNGFKRTLIGEMKNSHIFRTAAGHLGHPDFDYILGRAGGQFELIADVYEEAYRVGGLANIPFGSVKEVTIQIYGRNVRFKAKNLTEFGINQIRIDDFWIP